MKRLVNGLEVELDKLDLDVSRLPDRVLVHTPEGTFSAVSIRLGDKVLVSWRGAQYRIEPLLRQSAASPSSSGELRAPMPGTVVAVNVREGDRVTAGTTLLVLEAMKTQQPFAAPFDGIVEKLPVSVGTTVSDGALLAFLTSSADTQNRVSE